MADSFATLAARGLTNGASQVSSMSTLASGKSTEVKKTSIGDGLAYTFGRLGLGTFGILEGIWDYTAGGLAKLFGADDWAEEQFANNITGNLTNDLENKYQVTDGWRTAGDVVSGIGNSLVGVAAVAGAAAIAYFSGGTLSNVAAGIIAGTVMGFGAAGMATTQAYEKTGELGAKEFGYGALSGALEAGMEIASGGLGYGAGAAYRSVAKGFGKEVAKSAVRQTVAKEAVKGFLGEAFEEGVQEFLDPYILRWTQVDPEAKNATIQEIGYAALVGGLSGAIMGGVNQSINSTISLYRGNKISQDTNKINSVIEQAKNLSAFESENDTGSEAFQVVKSTLQAYQESMSAAEGVVPVTVKQKILLAQLERANTAAIFSPIVNKSAENIINNADALVERINSYGLKDENGAPLSITKEQLLAGYDGSNKSAAKALKSNDILRGLAVADAVGKLSLDAKAYSQALQRGQVLGSQIDLNRFKETATKQELESVGALLGISDWNTITQEELQAKAAEYYANGGAAQYQGDIATIKAIKETDGATAKPLPKTVSMATDGAQLFTYNGFDFAIVKKGNTYRVYNTAEGIFSKALSQKELNTYVSEIRKGADDYTAQRVAAKKTGTATAESADVIPRDEIDTYARTSVSGYHKLSEPAKVMVRETIRTGRANNVAVPDILSAARIATHSGINVVFSQELCKIGTKEDGSDAFADGYYDLDNKRIVLNPNFSEKNIGFTTKSGKIVKYRNISSLLIHELTHAIYNTADGKLILEKAISRLSKEDEERILAQYKNQSAAVKIDEIQAHYAEGILSDEAIIERLCREEQSFKEKVLSFFKGTYKAYHDDARLSKETKALYKHYKKLFDSFSEQNQGGNAIITEKKAAGTATRMALAEGTFLEQLDRLKNKQFKSSDQFNLGETPSYMSDLGAKSGKLMLKISVLNKIVHTHGVAAADVRNMPELINSPTAVIVKTPELLAVIGNSSRTTPQLVSLKLNFDFFGQNVQDITSSYYLEDIGQYLTDNEKYIVFPKKIESVEALAKSLSIAKVRPQSNSTERITDNKNTVKRYALSIDGDTVQGGVQEGKNLVALHNLNESKLMRVLELGGFPMPSIAITKPTIKHEGFGDITIVFGRESIDPQSNKRNKVYSMDSWTPTVPTVEYKVNAAKEAAIHKKYKELAKKLNNYEIVRPLYQYANTLEDALNREGGETGIIENLYNNDEVKQIFLLDSGKNIVAPIYREQKIETSRKQVELNKLVIAELGENIIRASHDNGDAPYFTYRHDYVKTHRQELIDILAKFALKHNAVSSFAEGQQTYADTSDIKLFKLVNDAYLYLNNNGVIYQRVFDSAATAEAINKAVNQQDYQEWIDNLFRGVELKKGIRNDADMFTYSGSRRSFEATHYTYNVQNIVRAMLEGEQKGGGSIAGLSVPTLAAKLSREFKTVDEIRDFSENLSISSPEARENFSDTARQMLDEIANDMVDERKYSDNVQLWTALDGAQSIVGEIADKELFSLSQINAYIKREYGNSTYKYSERIGNKILGLFEYVKQYTATDYFEAKPRRAVGFDEIKAVLLPKTASKQLISKLSDRGIPYQFYSEEHGRSEVIQKMDNIRFALPETDSEGNPLTPEQREFFKDSKVVDDNGSLRVVYHGTNAEFFTFDKKKLGKGTDQYGAGYYFATDKVSASNYGSRIIKSYLNISNPYIIDGVASGGINRFYHKKITPPQAFDILQYHPLIKDSEDSPLGNFSERFWEEGATDSVMQEVAEQIGEIGLLYDNSMFGYYPAEMLEAITDVLGIDGLDIDFANGQHFYIAFEQNQAKLTTNTAPTINPDIRYALAADNGDVIYTTDVEVRFALSESTLDFLNSQKAVKVYRAMQIIDGELYPPMAAKVKSKNGKKQLVAPSRLSEWEEAVERPDLIRNGKFELDKANGSSIEAAYNPYFHTSLSPLNDQFTSAYKRRNLVVVEGEVPVSELTSGYKAQYAKDAVGATSWHSGVVSSKLTGEKARKVILSRWFKPVRIMTDTEVAQIIAKTLEGENIDIPYNVVTPSLRSALEKKGVKIRFALSEQQQQTQDDYSLRIDQIINNIEEKRYEIKRKGEGSLYDETGAVNQSALKELRAIYEKGNIESREDSDKFDRYISEIGGFVSEDTYEEGGEYICKMNILKPEFYTRSMIQTTIDSKKVGMKVVVFSGAVLLPDVGSCRGFTVEGSGRTIYISTRGSEGKDIDLKANKFNSPVLAVRHDNGSLATTLHERFHALRIKGNADALAMVGYIYNNKKFDDINFGYQRKFYQEYQVGFDYVCEEIAADFYAGNITINDAELSERLMEYVISINENNGFTVYADGKNIRYALSEDTDGIVGGMTRGQRAKFVANNTRIKVYSKAETSEIIDSIINDRLVMEDGYAYGKLSGQNRDAVVEYLWRKLNTTDEGYRLGVALRIADYLIANATVENMYGEAGIEESERVLAALRPYLHSLDLSGEGMQAEIQHRFDKKNTVNLLWGAAKGTHARAVDDVAMELEEQGIYLDAINEKDQLIKIVELYESARAAVRKKVDKRLLSDFGSKEELEKMRKQIARDVLLAYDNKGTQSSFGKRVEKYTERIANLKKTVTNTVSRTRTESGIVENIRTLKDYRKGEYLRADFLVDARLDAYERALSQIKYGADLRKKGYTVRGAIAQLDGYFRADILDTEEVKYFDQSIRDDISMITANYKDDSKNTLPPTLDELHAIFRITRYIKYLYKEYNTVFWQNKRQETVSVATTYKEGIAGVKPLSHLSTPFRNLLNPYDRMTAMQEYAEHGVYSDFYDALQASNDKKATYLKEAGSFFAEFTKKHKGYQDSLRKELGNGLTKGEAISLLLTYERAQGKKYLSLAGAKIQVANDKYAKKGNRRKSVDYSVTVDFSTSLLPELTETDREFIECARKYFQWSGLMISEAEMERFGFANAKEENYYPISVSGDEIFDLLGESRRDSFSLARPSFTYHLQEVGKGKKLFIANIVDVINSQMNQSSTFYGYSNTINNIAKIWNVDIGGVKLKERTRGIDPLFGEWFQTYLQDIQGINRNIDTYNRIFGKLRSWSARAALGLNPKVWLNQLTSIPMAKAADVDYRSQAKGFLRTVFGGKKNFVATYNEMVEYAPEVWQRYQGNVAIKDALGLQAQSRFDEIMDKTTAPIEFMDKLVVTSLWSSCKQQNNGDMSATVSQFKKMLRLTQDNHEAINKSAILRSQNELMKTALMYINQPLQIFSRLYTAADKLRVAVKNKDAALTKVAKKELKITLSAFVVQTVMYVAVAQLFKWLLDKDRKDKDRNEISLGWDIARDFGGAVFGLLPFVRDIYTYFTDGYEPENVAYSSFSNILNSVAELFEGCESLFSGNAENSVNIMGSYRKFIVNLTQTFGIPLRNLERYTVGIVNLFDPASAYKYNSLFYNKNYTADINKALKEGDTELAESILDILLDDDKAGKVNESTRSTILDLYSKGFAVLPKTVGTSLTYNGEKNALTKAQKEAFDGTYGKANYFVEKMTSSSAFSGLSDESKAKAIKQIYDAYYSKALSDTLGVSEESKLYTLSLAIDMSKLSSAVAKIAEITTDTDTKGVVINGSKKKNVISYLLSQSWLTDAERLMIIMYLGYTISDNEYKRMTAIQAKRLVAVNISRAGISTTDKAKLAQICSLTVRNGKIVLK